MNIFVLDKSPKISARYHCDKHTVKMIVESAQMLSTTHRMLDGVMERRPSKSGSMIQYFKLSDSRENTLYKACHFNHPSTIWTRQSKANYDWHYTLFAELCKEYTHRYGRTHMTESKLIDVLAKAPDNIPDGELTAFPQAMPEDCKKPDPIEAYRTYYVQEKKYFAKWTNREIPSWFLQENA
jgi:hypothetical protein